MNGETKSEDKKKDDKNKELNLAMMVEHLHRKNFHPRLISKLTDFAKTLPDPVKYFMSVTKQQLRVSHLTKAPILISLLPNLSNWLMVN